MLVAAGAAVPLEHKSEAGVLFRTVRLIGGVIAVTSIELDENTNTCSINPRAGILDFISLCPNLIRLDMIKATTFFEVDYDEVRVIAKSCRFLRDLALPHDEGDGWKLEPLARHCKHLEKLNVSSWFNLADSWVHYVAMRCTSLSVMVVSHCGKLSTSASTIAKQRHVSRCMLRSSAASFEFQADRRSIPSCHPPYDKCARCRYEYRHGELVSGISFAPDHSRTEGAA